MADLYFKSYDCKQLVYLLTIFTMSPEQYTNKEAGKIHNSESRKINISEPKLHRTIHVISKPKIKQV